LPLLREVLAGHLGGRPLQTPLLLREMYGKADKISAS
jgi:hypothetical protein